MSVYERLPWIQKIQGFGKLQWLKYVADTIPELENECLELLEEEILTQGKQSHTNTSLYKHCIKKLNKEPHKTFSQQVDSRAALKLERLNNDLTTAYQHIQKNQVRVCTRIHS